MLMINLEAMPAYVAVPVTRMWQFQGHISGVADGASGTPRDLLHQKCWGSPLLLAMHQQRSPGDGMNHYTFSVLTYCSLWSQVGSLASCIDVVWAVRTAWALHVKCTAAWLKGLHKAALVHALTTLVILHVVL